MRLRRLLPALVSAFLLAGCERNSGPVPMPDKAGGEGEPAATAFEASQVGRPERALPQGLAAPLEEPIEVRLEPGTPVAAGKAAQVRVSFHPRPHIKVPIYPPAYAESFDVYGGLTAPPAKVPARVLTPEEEDKGRLAYYEGDPPDVFWEVGVPAGTASGGYPFSARVHYFYCSDAGGICAKRDVRVEGVVDVKGLK